MSTELATIDAPAELRESVAACVQWSNSNCIESAEAFQITGEHLKQIKSRQKQADEFFDPPIKQAYDLHKMLVARKKLITDPLITSERTDKSKMLAYQQAEAEKAEAERRRLQAIADEKARKERERAEQEAQKQRQIEAEARAKAEGARKAAEEADAAEKRRLLAEADAAERKANAAAVKVEAKQEQAAQVAAPVVHVATVAPVVKGIATKKVWKAEIVDREALLNFICANNRHDLIIVNDKVLDAFAKSMREGAKVPGVKFFASESISSRVA